MLFDKERGFGRLHRKIRNVGHSRLRKVQVTGPNVLQECHWCMRGLRRDQQGVVREVLAVGQGTERKGRSRHKDCDCWK